MLYQLSYFRERLLVLLLNYYYRSLITKARAGHYKPF